jgi:nitrate reductase NapAB chaperone NapD
MTWGCRKSSDVVAPAEEQAQEVEHVEEVRQIDMIVHTSICYSMMMRVGGVCSFN